MTKEERELIELKFTSMHATIKSNHDMEMLELKHIKDYQLKQNGRVDKIESETKIVRFFESHKFILILVIIGILALAGYNGFAELFKMIK